MMRHRRSAAGTPLPDPMGKNKYQNDRAQNRSKQSVGDDREQSGSGNDSASNGGSKATDQAPVNVLPKGTRRNDICNDQQRQHDAG